MHLRIEKLYKIFDEFVALDRISLDVNAHDFVCLLGPSGCGKTTLLRIIAGLLPFDGGSLMLGDRDLATIPARDRGFGIVFQSYSLFPTMTAAENVAYGLKIRGQGKAERSARAHQLLEMVRLGHLADRYPHQLSGGQQQRVAIARSLAVDPALLLLDEPLSALDAQVRAEMRSEIREVQRRLGIPTIMVTHDQEEALTMADKVVCMNHGRIEQVGSPQDLYMRPRTRFVADFVGISNIVPASWVAEALPDLFAARPEEAEAGFDLCLRPESLRVDTDPAGDAVVTDMTFLGNLNRLSVTWKNQDLIIETHGWNSPSVGDRVSVSALPQAGAWVRP